MSLKLGEGNRINSQNIIANSGNTFGTNYSYLGVGGFYELSNIQERNQIPIDSLLLMNSDGRSSGRRRLGMIVHTLNDNKYWQLLPQLKVFYKTGNQTFIVYDSNNRVTENIWNTLKDPEKLVLLDPKASVFDSTTNRFYFGSGNAATAWYDTPLQVYITGGTYNSGTTTLSLFDTSGNTISITGVKSPDVTITAYTYNPSSNTFTIRDSRNSVFNATIDSVNGFNVNGTLTVNTVSANTYINLPIDPDTKVVDFDYLNNTFTIKDNFGNTFNATINNVTGLTVNGTLNAGTIFANNYQNLPPDSDRYVTGFTYNNNTFTIRDNSGSSFNSTFNTVTGLTINGNLDITGNTLANNLSANTISATTFSGGSFFGNGSGLTNIQNLYTVDGKLTGNRRVDVDDKTLSFTSSLGTLGNNNEIVFYKNFYGDLFVGNDSKTALLIGKTTAETPSQYTVDLGSYSNLRIDNEGNGYKGLIYNPGISDFQVGKYPTGNLNDPSSIFFGGPGGGYPQLPATPRRAEGFNVNIFSETINIGHLNSGTVRWGFGTNRSRVTIGHDPLFQHGLVIAPWYLKDATDNQQASSLQVVSSRRLGDNSDNLTLWLKHYGDSAIGPRILFERDKTSPANWGYGTDNKNVVAGDQVFVINSRVSTYSSTGLTFPDGRPGGARIRSLVENVVTTPGAQRLAANLIFDTTDGINTQQERLRIAGSGNVLINTSIDGGFRLDVNGTGRFANTLRLDTVNLSPTDTRILTLGPSNVVQYQDLSTITAATSADTYTTAFTYSNNTFTLNDNSGLTLNATINTVTGLTVNGNLNITGTTNSNIISATTISGGTFFGNASGLTNLNVCLSANTGLDKNNSCLYTIYNSSLNPNIQMTSGVGGLPVGTTVASLSAFTLVQLLDRILFPTVNPTYTIPTISLLGISNQTLQVGSTFSPTITVRGTKNDAGSFTRLRIFRTGTTILNTTTPSTASTTNVPNQFGFNNPNNPNILFNGTFSESIVIPRPVGVSQSSSLTYFGDGNYNSGLAKQNSSGNIDTRPFLVRSTNNPQLSANTFTTGTVTITGIYPYFYGKSPTLPSASSIASQIASGGATLVLSPASGTISIPYNANNEFFWVAYFTNYTTKTKWFVTALNNGDVDGSFITSATTQNINSPTGLWNNIQFKLHWSVYPTIVSTLEYRNI